MLAATLRNVNHGFLFSPRIAKESNMKRLISAAILTAAAALATPASAQEVIYNPGYCAQFYPNANCQNKGPGNPYTARGYHRGGWQGGYAAIGPRWHRRHYRHYRRW